MKTFTLILAIVALSFTTLNAQIAKTGSIGIGLGVPYGVLGINGEIAVHKNFSLSAGLGSTLIAGLGYAVGARAYLNPPEKKWRPRISLHYGINSMVAVQENSGDLPKDGKKFSGLTLGIGTLAMFGEKRKSGFDFEIAYLATTGGLKDEIDKMNASGVYEQIDMPGKIKIILGYRFGINYSKPSISPKSELQVIDNNVPNETVEENLVFVGGGFNLSTNKIKETYNSDTQEGDKTLSFSFFPKVGYFINNNIALGVGLGISTYKVTTPSTTYDPEEVYTENSWAFGPFARYYYARTGNFSFFGEGIIGFGGGKSKNTIGSNTTEGPKLFTIAVGVSPALSYNLSDKVSLEAKLGGITYSSASSTSEYNTDEHKVTSSGIGLNLGLDDITFGAIIKF